MRAARSTLLLAAVLALASAAAPPTPNASHASIPPPALSRSPGCATEQPSVAWAAAEDTVSGEIAVTFSLPFSQYRASPAFANALVAAAIAPLLGLPPLQLAVGSAAPAAAGQGTALGLVLLTHPGANASAHAAALVALFDSATPGASAKAPLAAALRASFPAGFAAVLGPAPHPPPPPLADMVDPAQGQTLAVSLPFYSWQQNQAAYSAAVQQGVAEAMGIPAETVWVVQAVAASQGGTAVMLNMITPATTSSESAAGQSLALPVLGFARLFGGGDGFDAQSGDAARPLLVAALRRYGLPVNSAFYGDVTPAPTSRRLAAVQPRRVLFD